MLSILKVNNPPAAEGWTFRMGLSSLYEKTPKKRCVAMFHAAFFVTQRFSYSQRKMGVYSITFCLFHQLCHFFDDDMAQLVLAHLRILFHMSVLVQERCDICGAVEAGARHGHIIGDKHIQVLSFEL